MKRADGRL